MKYGRKLTQNTDLNTLNALSVSVSDCTIHPNLQPEQTDCFNKL